MKISKADESSLLIALTEGLQGARVMHYGYIALPPNWEDGVKAALDEDFRKRLFAALDDGGLESLIQRQLFKEFYEEGLELPDKETPRTLSSYKIFKDPLATARGIVATIKSLPKQYEVIVRACNGLAPSHCDPNTSLRIYDRMHLISGAQLADKFVTTTGNELVDSEFQSYNSHDQNLRYIDPSALYFVYRTSGLVTDRSKPKPFEDFYDDLRAFYGAAVSFGLFYAFPSPKLKSPVAVLANLLDGDAREYRHCEVADSDIADGAALLTKKYLDRLIASNASLEDIFAPVIKLFNSEESQRLKTAAIWLLRAHRTAKGMDQILDSTIAIEVLLGDREASDRVGLSKLMANRCAYSLGKSASERKELFDFFTHFYRVRSDIVHSGRMKLSEDEAEVVQKGTELASRILRHETEIG